MCRKCLKKIKNEQPHTFTVLIKENVFIIVLKLISKLRYYGIIIV